MKRILTIIFVTALFSGPAAAKDWVIDYGHSKLGFVGAQNGKTFNGSFGKFTSAIDFDPAHPEAGKITATIDMASAATGNSTRDNALPDADWFNVKQFPQAQFVSDHIVSTGLNSFEAQGVLTIKGISKSIVLPFTLQQENDHWRAQGKASLIRTQFSVGQGDWANEDTVAFAVDVIVDIAAKPAP